MKDGKSVAEKVVKSSDPLKSYVRGKCLNLNMFSKLRQCCTTKTTKFKEQARQKCGNYQVADPGQWCANVPDEEQAQVVQGAARPSGSFGYYEHQPGDPCATMLWRRISFVALVDSSGNQVEVGVNQQEQQQQGQEDLLSLLVMSTANNAQANAGWSCG